MLATQRGRNSMRAQLQNGSFEPPSLIESPKHKGIDNIAESIVQQILLALEAPKALKRYWEVMSSIVFERLLIGDIDNVGAIGRHGDKVSSNIRETLILRKHVRKLH